MSKRHRLKKPSQIVKNIILWGFLLFLFFIGSHQTNLLSAANSETEATNLTVSAASSLKDAMVEIEQIYSKEQPKVTITYNFGGSGSLQQQIEQGAPVDVFISASAKQIDTLHKKELIVPDTRKNLLKNRLVLVVPKDNTTITDLKSLTDASVNKIAIAEPESVPAGQYAKEVLTNIGIFDQIQAKIVFAKDVRQVLNYVETGNVDGGIVYVTDAKTSDRIRIAATAAENLHSPIIYPVALIKGSQNQTAAKEFMQFMEGDRAETVFTRYGFLKAQS